MKLKTTPEALTHRRFSPLRKARQSPKANIRRICFPSCFVSPAPSPDPPILSKEEAAEYRRRLSLISDSTVRKDYVEFWNQRETKAD
jgi:hypothetical protein